MNRMDDLIRRQDAVDVLNDGAELLRRALDDMDVVMDERKKFEWGLGLIEAYIAYFINLPSAQPEPEHTMEEFMYGQDLGSPEDGSL